MRYLFFVFCFLLSPLFAHEQLEDGIFIQRNSNPLSTGPRVAMLTVIIDETDSDCRDVSNKGSYAQQVAFGTKSKELYARKYGYDLIRCTRKLNECYGIPASRPLEAAWSKVALIAKCIDDYDWVFWTDADSIILNFDIRLEDFLDDAYDIIAATQVTSLEAPCLYCPEIKFINTGQVFYKNSPLTKEILAGAWKNHVNYIPGLYEQIWINRYIQEHELQEHVLVYPPSAFNSRGDEYMPGEFIAHMYGSYGDNLFDAFKQFERIYGFILRKEEALQKGK